jgi:hypothetical protein
MCLSPLWSHLWGADLVCYLIWEVLVLSVCSHLWCFGLVPDLICGVPGFLSSRARPNTFDTETFFPFRSTMGQWRSEWLKWLGKMAAGFSLGSTSVMNTAVHTDSTVVQLKIRMVFWPYSTWHTANNWRLGMPFCFKHHLITSATQKQDNYEWWFHEVPQELQWIF